MSNNPIYTKTHTKPKYRQRQGNGDTLKEKGNQKSKKPVNKPI